LFLLKIETLVSFSSETFIWIYEGEDFSMNNPQGLYQVPSSSAVWCSTCRQSVKVSTVLLLFEMRGADPPMYRICKNISSVSRWLFYS